MKLEKAKKAKKGDLIFSALNNQGFKIIKKEERIFTIENQDGFIIKIEERSLEKNFYYLDNELIDFLKKRIGDYFSD
jgi:hypothetical protein